MTLFVQAKKYLALHHDRQPAVRYFEPWVLLQRIVMSILRERF